MRDVLNSSLDVIGVVILFDDGEVVRPCTIAPAANLLKK
jgi:hypothetical protein